MGLFSKGAQDRIDQTINFIVDGDAPHVGVPAGEKNAVRGYLNHRLTNYLGGNAVSAISDVMSMNDLAIPGTAVERKMRRAIILIETVAIATPGNIVTNTKIASSANTTTRFGQVLVLLRELADQDRGNIGLLYLKYNEFKTHPRRFLQNNFVTVFGSMTDGQMDQFFGLEINGGVPRYKFLITNQGRPRCYRANVVNVPPVLWSAVPGRTAAAAVGSFANIAGTHLTGSDVMVTTQFSGCAFCVKNHGGSIYAAHIWPSDVATPGSGMPAGGGNGGATRLARQLAGLEPPVVGGGFAAPAPAGGVFQVYGMGYSNYAATPAGYPVGAPPHNWMTLVGVNKGGAGWRFYSQHVVNQQIAAVVRVA